MATPVYIIKRPLRSKQRNGKRKYRYALRWEDPETGNWKCETTATADKVEAECLQKLKWAEVNGLTPNLEPEPEPEKPRPTWSDCREAMQRAMQADNLRPSYVADSLLVLKGLEAMFPDLESPADVTPAHANEYKRRRSEAKKSPWTIRGDLSTLKAVFGKWLGAECGLLDPQANPFFKVKPPRCDDPDVRIVSAAESKALFDWLANRWNNWKLPGIYLDVAALLGWRATEIASIREEDLLADGYVKVVAETCKTRRVKYGWLPPELHEAVKGCCAGEYAFGRFSDELRRLLMIWKQRPHHAARVRDFEPRRLVGWLQDELKRFNDDQAEKAMEAGTTWEAFTLHDFRRTAITGLQMSGVSEKEASVMVGATPEVMRKHYERLDQLAIAKRSVQRRLGADSPVTLSLRAGCAQGIDETDDSSQTLTA